MADVAPFDLIAVDRVREWINTLGSFTGSDDVYAAFCSAVTDVVEDYCGRNFRPRTRTEYYDGRGRKDLLLDHRPIISVTSIHDDTSRVFESNSLIASTKYVIEGGPGVIRAWNWGAFGDGTLNVKVIYVAGQGMVVETGINDTIDITDAGGTAAVAITAGTYSEAGLATQIATDLNADATLTGTLTCVYNPGTQKFTIGTDDNTTVILWSSGPTSSARAAGLLGYTADEEAGTSFVSDRSVNGALFQHPSIELICKRIIAQWHGFMSAGGRVEGELKTYLGNPNTKDYAQWRSTPLEPDVQMMLDMLKTQRI